MPRLTATERNSFSADQLVELDRMSDTRQSDLLEPPLAEGETRTTQETADLRAKTQGRWANQTVAQCKVTTNVQGSGSTLDYTSDNNYTSEEQRILTAGWKSNRGNKVINEIPAILVEAARLDAAGVDAAIRDGILWSRG